ncbi:G8 domain-containing protein [Marinivivus vitaminiproducens]|uniref:G8 domain-containing protein n=1 Tax=Marinivivus vitaminiproducens TaxID=3035935 RepID=UPI00279BFA22|nr:G8 domain-containing protein [Geminicoccaceae bacterium SCSIO 64248]
MDEHDDHEFRDPQMEAEHQAALDLVRPEEATHVAVQNGAWFDPATWEGGQVPDPGSIVHIPEGITVGYNGTSDSSINKIRVDGKLDFTTDTDTKLVVDTMVVQPGAVLEIGTADDPIQSDHTANIVFADNGSVNDLDWDVRQLSRGLINLGDLEMHGEDKTSFMRVATDPMAGDSSITLASAPSNWQVGDTIVLTGTTYVPKSGTSYRGSQDEVLTIASIDGATVTFEETLEYSHDTPASELKAYAANMTRNITLESQNTAEVDHRGHVMSMHSNNVAIENAAFVGLGRTDKSEPLDDREVVPGSGGYNSYEATVVRGDVADNMRGRYAVHLHRTGADDDAATIEGSVVWGSPGWGMVSHDSHADFIDNVAYDVFGAHYASETGNERGEWSHNIAIKGEGRARTRDEAADFAAHDLGYGGDGFWFNGRQIVAQDNVAAGMQGYGYSWVGRGSDMINSTAGALKEPAIANYRDPVASWRPSIKDFSDNQVMASTGGLLVHRLFPQGHDDRSIIDGFHGWDVKFGFKGLYSNNYIVRNSDFYAANVANSIGFDLSTNTESFTLDDVSFTDFQTGVLPRKNFSSIPAEGDHQYIFVGVDFDNVGTEYGGNFDSAVDRVLPAGSISSGPLRLDLDDTSLQIKVTSNSVGNLSIQGTKHDSLGAVEFPAGYERIDLNVSQIRNALTSEGYATLLDGTRVIRLEVLYTDRGTGEIKIQPFLAVFDSNYTITSTTPFNGTYVRESGTYVPADLISSSDIATERTNSDGTITILGGAGNDTLEGRNSHVDRLDGQGGNDLIRGRSGADYLYGASGSDTLYGAAGANSLYGGSGNDVLEGGDDNDRMYGGDGSDTLRGASGSNVGYGGGDNDSLYGESGADTFYGDDGDDELYGAAGADTLFGGVGDDRIVAGSGHDKIYAGVGVDTINGDEGNDLIYGHAGDDIIRSGSGNDRIYAGSDMDTIYGFDGSDTLYGDLGDDAIYGENDSDSLYGGGDNDVVDGGAGDDTLYGDAGNDDVYGRSGDDVAYGGDGEDNLYGSDGADQLYGDDSSDTLLGYNGNDTLYGGAGDDNLKGESDDDELNGGDGNDTLDGGSGDDALYGDAGNDVLYGRSGHDEIFGGAGNDELFGSDGDDVLDGGSGVDRLNGYTGGDRFVLSVLNDSGFDVVADFGSGDQLDFSDVLSNFDPDTDDIGDFLIRERIGRDAYYHVDPDGLGGSTAVAGFHVVSPGDTRILTGSLQSLVDQDIILA